MPLKRGWQSTATTAPTNARYRLVNEDRQASADLSEFVGLRDNELARPVLADDLWASLTAGRGDSYGGYDDPTEMPPLDCTGGSALHPRHRMHCLSYRSDRGASPDPTLRVSCGGRREAFTPSRGRRPTATHSHAF